MVNITTNSISQIKNSGFFSGSINSLFLDPGPITASLKECSQFWGRLGVDKFMKDGCKYRSRRFGEVEYNSLADKFTLLPQRAHFQPSSINPLNGGVQRIFDQIEPQFHSTFLFASIVNGLGRELSKLEGGCDWRINVHQVRISANDLEQGKPVPEGIHRDGITYGILLLMNRADIHSGGHTTIFSADRQPLFERTLLNPGDCVIYNDRLFLHDTTPLKAISGKTAYRDMFIVEFTSSEDETQVIVK